MSTKKNSTREIAISALFVALTYIATWLLDIRLPFMGSGGLIHLGNVPLFIAAMVFGKRVGFFAGSLGMGFFDLMSGWTAWAPFTFVIVGLMGWTVGVITEKKPFKKMFANDVLSVIAALAIKIVGYYIAEGIIYGNWVAPMGSIPGNVLQVGVAGIIALIFVPQLRKLMHK